jgi:hypothetical protein
LFLQLWFVVMFFFFSVSLGKRPVYLLPVYPALSLLFGRWFDGQGVASGTRLLLYRGLAALLAFVGVVLFAITVGGLWNHDPGWFFGPIEGLLKPKDRANLSVVRNELASFGWSFTVVSLLSAALWLSLAQCFWNARLKTAACRLVLISVLITFITRGVVIPEMAQARSYRDFMQEVNQRIAPNAPLYLYGDDFNGDAVIFYRGEIIPPFERARLQPDGGEPYLIMAEQTWKELQAVEKELPPPILKSE